MNAKDTLRRMLFLDGLLSLGGILVATVIFLVSLDEQTAVTEQLYQHPFAVSNAALDLKMDTLTLRNRMLELGLGVRSVQEGRPEIVELRRRIADDLDVVHKLFLGDLSRVHRMDELVADWNRDQESTFSDLTNGRGDAAQYRIGHSTEKLVDELLSHCEYVTSSARGKAAEFVAESRGKYRRTLQFIIACALSLSAAYLVVFVKRARAKRELFEQLHTQAIYDDLTGAHNRKAFVDLAKLEIERARRLGSDLSLIAIDIDHFKRINDDHGHAAGDTVLRVFGGGCQSVLRAIDTFGRVGGEEFAVLLPGASMQEASDIAERIRAQTEQALFRTAAGTLKVTVSAGVAALDGRAATVDQLMVAADAALYEAKRGGRNRIVLAGGAPAAEAIPASPAA